MVQPRPDSSFEINALIARLVARQHGVLAHWQLRAYGVSRGSIRARLVSGRIVPVHHGVYAISPSQLSAKGRWMAAVLAVGPGAVLSHWSAAGLWQLERPKSVTEVVKKNGMSRRIMPINRYGEVVVHSTRRLRPHEVITVGRIPVTSVERTTIDLAAAMTRRELDGFLAEADRHNLLHLNRLEEEIARWRGRKGIGLLRRVLSEWHPATDEEMSLFERQFVEAIVAAGAPRPQVNPLVGKHLIDCLWEELKVMIELDGHSYHRDPATQTKDAQRDRKHTLMGYQISRFTWQEFKQDRDLVIEQAIALLRHGARRQKH
ncbi:MAG: DUF559 domain-containing protein [Propioniciclava sp.]